MPPPPAARRPMLVVRRLHLYLGLVLMPWAVLYAVTAFLFNHPAAFADAPTVNFGPSAVVGTPLDGLPSPDKQAAAVVARLNETQKPATPYVVGPGAAYTGREFAFVTARAGDRTFGLLYDPKTGSGTARETTAPPVPSAPPAPFAVGGSTPPRPASPPAGVTLPGSLAERLKDAAPAILERCGFPAAEVAVTSTPDLSFPLVADGVTWTATYNPLTGAVSGILGDAPRPPEVSVRRFLLRLHTAHGYPGEVNARWAWAVVVDAMAFVMGFWGLSGLAMWWQLKATRRSGAVALAAGVATAVALGVAMRQVVT